MSSSDELTVAGGMGCACKNVRGGWGAAWEVDLVGRVSEAAAVVAVVTEVTAGAVGVVEVGILEVGWEVGEGVVVCLVATSCISGVEVVGCGGGNVDK